MKRLLPLITVLMMAAFSGCLVSSLHPFFKQKDKFYDPVMVGNWIDDDSCIWSIQPNIITEYFMGPEKADSTYRITYYEEPDKPGLFIGTLFQIKGIPYVDFYPEPNEEHCVNDFTCWHHFPTHTLARVRYNKDSIMLYWLAEEWLNDLLAKNRIRIKHETVEMTGNTRHLLTASTDELQKFIKKYVNGPQLSGDIEKAFTRGYGDDENALGVFLKLKPYPGPLPGPEYRQVKAVTSG